MSKSRYLFLRNQHECKCIYLSKLIYILIDNYLSKFYIYKNQFFVCTISLKDLELELTPDFFRISRNCIINMNFIDTINTKHSFIMLTDGSKLSVSKSKIRKLKVHLQSQIFYLQGRSIHSQVPIE